MKYVEFHNWSRFPRILFFENIRPMPLSRWTTRRTHQFNYLIYVWSQNHQRIRLGLSALSWKYFLRGLHFCSLLTLFKLFQLIGLNQTLAEFIAHPQAWTRVDTILSMSQSNSSKMIGLRVLEDLIAHRWNILPKDQQKAIRDFIVDNIIKTSSSDENKARQAPVLRKMNGVLVSVRYPRFKIRAILLSSFIYIISISTHVFSTLYSTTQFRRSRFRPCSSFSRFDFHRNFRFWLKNGLIIGLHSSTRSSAHRRTTSPFAKTVLKSWNISGTRITCLVWKCAFHDFSLAFLFTVRPSSTFLAATWRTAKSLTWKKPWRNSSTLSISYVRWLWSSLWRPHSWPKHWMLCSAFWLGSPLDIFLRLRLWTSWLQSFSLLRLSAISHCSAWSRWPRLTPEIAA